MTKVWFVTGSSRGLGRALVEVALEAGDRVAATARNPERLQDLLDKYGDAVLPLRLDVSDYDAAVRVVAQAEETFGRIDIVVNCAGYSDLGSFEDTTIDSFRTQIDTNFYGVVNVSKAAVPVLREQGSGHIFQISSLSVRLSAPGLSAATGAKRINPSNHCCASRITHPTTRVTAFTCRNVNGRMKKVCSNCRSVVPRDNACPDDSRS